ITVGQSIDSMDFSKQPDEKKAHYCKKYTMIGVFLLPFVWLTSLVIFTPFALKGEPSVHRTTVRRCLAATAIGVLLWAVALICWESIFQHYRTLHAVWTENWSFLLPVGKF
ncbi:pen-2, partial [Pristionchus pacificus]